jgi:hypothetical protein
MYILIMKDTLTNILDYILNRATKKELFAIKAAIQRRENSTINPAGESLSDMVTSMSSTIKKQMKVPLKQIRHSVRDMVIRMIKENVPGITDEQLKTLLDEWVPEPEKKKQATGKFPPDMVLAMIQQFIAFSVNKMPASEDAKLRAEMADWPQRYWRSFPESIQTHISHYLKGTMEEKTFWKNVLAELGMSG